MQCANCGSEMPDGAGVCPSCGAPTDATTVQESRLAQAREEKPRAKLGLIIAAGGLVLIAIIALIFALILSRRPGQVIVRSEVPPVRPGPPVTQAPVQPINPGPAVTQAQTPPPTKLPQKPPPPPEVVEYLKFVKEIEETRVAMRDAQAEYLLKKYVSGNLGKLLADMIGQLAEPEGEIQATEQPMEDLKIVAAAWENLIRRFDSRQAPVQCRNLAGMYRTALAQYCNAMARLFAAATQGDMTAAQRVNGIQDDLDKLLKQSDDELGRVCSEYGIERGFAITPDRGGGTVLQP